MIDFTIRRLYENQSAPEVKIKLRNFEEQVSLNEMEWIFRRG